MEKSVITFNAEGQKHCLLTEDDFARMRANSEARNHMKALAQKKQESKMEKEKTEEKSLTQAEYRELAIAEMKKAIGDPKDWRIGACATPYLQQMDLDSASEQDKESNI